MSIVPFPPRPADAADADAAAEPSPPRPFDQAELDRLYWHTQTPVREIAAAFGLSSSRLGNVATPLPTDLRCLLCGGVAVVPNRTQRNAPWIRCGACGAAVRQHDRRSSSTWRPASDATTDGLRLVSMPIAMVREPLHGDRDHLGRRARFALDALEQHGYRLEPGALVRTIGPLAGLDEIRSVLRSVGARPGVLGVASLRTLGATQTEALANLVELTSAGWRVASAIDVEIRTVIGFHQVRSSFDRDVRFRRTDWVDEPVDPDGLGFSDHLINATTDRPPWAF